MISYITTKGRSNLNTCEDSLTSSVLDLLKYLPTTLFWDILRESMYQKNLPKYCGELMSFEFWPNWNPEGTDNSDRVEPDVFLRFEDFDVIVEAKRYDTTGQTIGQFNNETRAYYNEYGEDDKLERDFYPLPHQPSIRKEFYNSNLELYLDFINRNFLKM